MATVRKKLDALPTPESERAARNEGLAIEGQDNEQVLTLHSRTIRTLEAALAEGKVDTAIWEVERWQLNKWDMGAKLPVNGTWQLAATELWQVKVWLRRKAPKAYTDAMEMLHERLAKLAPRYKFPKPRKPPGDLLAVPCLFDHHWGKLCWAEETGNNYDLKIAETIWQNAVDDILGALEPFGLARVLFPVGQDLINFDTLSGTTTAGTPQDCDGRYPKVIAAAVESLIGVGERLASRGLEVDFIYSGGNHDLLASYHICRELRAWFRHTKRINVDCEFRDRKYYEWGCVLLGIAHADKVKRKWDTLPNLIRQEAPEQFARTTYHEWLMGHEHHAQKKETLPAKEIGGVRMRTVPSLSARDAWHASGGYTAQRAAETYLYSKKQAYFGHLSVPAREG
jgi:hypothetical protein